MGSPVSPIVCNMYMEHFEKPALSKAPHPPGWRFRYVDDTHTKQKLEYIHVDELTDHINSIDPDIKFTIEKEENSKLTFLDINTIMNQDGSLKPTVYCKPTHTGQYLDFNSAHPNEHKLVVVRTLHQRAYVVTSDRNDLTDELKHVNSALKVCHYPYWAIKKVTRSLSLTEEAKEMRNKRRLPSKTKRNYSVTIPKGTVWSLKTHIQQAQNKYLLQANKTRRIILVHPKEKSDKYAGLFIT